MKKSLGSRAAPPPGGFQSFSRPGRCPGALRSQFMLNVVGIRADSRPTTFLHKFVVNKLQQWTPETCKTIVSNWKVFTINGFLMFCKVLQQAIPLPPRGDPRRRHTGGHNRSGGGLKTMEKGPRTFLEPPWPQPVIFRPRGNPTSVLVGFGVRQIGIYVLTMAPGLIWLQLGVNVGASGGPS